MNKIRNILAIDVAVRDIQVGLLQMGLLAAAAAQNHQKSDFLSTHIETERGQAEQLVPAMADILNRAEISPQSLDLIAVTRGPGSFTGVRIGLATARSFAMALNIPVVGFSTLELILGNLISGAEQQSSVFPATLALIDTKRGDYYGLSTGMALNHHPPRIFTPEDRQNYDGQVILDSLPPIEYMARLAASLNTADYGTYPPTPIYIRDAEIHQKNGG